MIESRVRSFNGPTAKLIEKFILSEEWPDWGSDREFAPCLLCFRDLQNWQVFCSQELKEVEKMSSFFVN
jgi:hypothetical protein